jgi:hypothetical protein
MKLLSSLLALCLCFAMVGCDEADYETENPDIPAAEPDGLDPTYDADEPMDDIGDTPGSFEPAYDPDAIDPQPTPPSDPLGDDTPMPDPTTGPENSDTPGEPAADDTTTSDPTAEEQTSGDDPSVVKEVDDGEASSEGTEDES